MHHAIMLVPRIIAFMAGLAVGSSVAMMSYENGLSFAPGLLGTFAAIGFAGATIGCWFLPSIAGNTNRSTALFLMSVWALGTAFVIANGVRFTATHLDESTGGKADKIVTYDQALTDLRRLGDELEVAKKNDRWTKTAGCADVTVPKSDAYCGAVKGLKAQLSAAQAVIAAGRPKSADPGGDRLSAVLRVSHADVEVYWPVLQSIALDLLATALMVAAFAPWGDRKAAAPLVDDRRWLSEHAMPRHLPRVAGPFRFNVDKRSMRADHMKRLAKNDLH